MSDSVGIYTCPVCGKQVYGDLRYQTYHCGGDAGRQHQPAAVIRTHDAVAEGSYAPVRFWSSHPVGFGS